MYRKEHECDLHANAKKIKFCKEPNCWERLCPYCAAERHVGHNIIEFSEILKIIKNEKEKLTLQKSLILSEYKEFLLDLEKYSKNIHEKYGKLRIEEKKIQIKMDNEIKKASENILLKKDIILSKIKRANEEINSERSCIMKSIGNLGNSVEKISLNGDAFDVKQFFEYSLKEKFTDPSEYKKMLNEIKEDFEHFIGLNYSFNENEKYINSPEISKNMASPIKLIEIKKSPEISENYQTVPSPSPKSQPRNFSPTNLLFHRKNKTFISLQKSSLSPSNVSVEEIMEKQRWDLEKLNLQIGEKKSALQLLCKMIESKGEQLNMLETALEKKKEQLSKIHSDLNESIQKCNLLFTGIIPKKPEIQINLQNTSLSPPKTKNFSPRSKSIISENKKFTDAMNSLKNMLKNHKIFFEENLHFSDLVKITENKIKELENKAFYNKKQENNKFNKNNLKNIKEITKKINFFKSEFGNLKNNFEIIKNSIKSIFFINNFSIDKIFENIDIFKEKFNKQKIFDEQIKQNLLDQCYLLENQSKSVKLTEKISNFKDIFEKHFTEFSNKIFLQNTFSSKFGIFFNFY